MTKNIDKIADRIRNDLASGEQLLAAVKVTPRGSIEQGILGAAGAVSLGAAGAILGSKLGETTADAGTDEREAAGIDLGQSSQVLAGLTNQRLLMWKLSALGGKPKELLASIDVGDLAGMTMGESKLFGQTMPEIVCTTSSGAEFGLRVAKVHRSQAMELLAAAGF